MSLSATARTKFYIGTTLATTDEASYATDTYKLIKNTENLGEIGSESEIMAGKFIDADYARKMKGTRDNGTMTITAALDMLDPGQIAIIAAEKSDYAFNFKVQFNDAPSGGTPTIVYFKAYVASAKMVLDEANNFTKLTFALAIDGAILPIPAAED